MRAKRMSVLVDGERFAFTEHAGILKASMNGTMGWTKIWATAPDFDRAVVELKRRIQSVLRGSGL